MKRYDDDYENASKLLTKKRPKHASNRPGEGMRVLNKWVEEEDIDLDEIDNDEYTMYTNYSNQRT